VVCEVGLSVGHKVTAAEVVDLEALCRELARALCRAKVIAAWAMLARTLAQTGAAIGWPALALSSAWANVIVAMTIPLALVVVRTVEVCGTPSAVRFYLTMTVRMSRGVLR
jgi:hypothetical protein